VVFTEIIFLAPSAGTGTQESARMCIWHHSFLQQHWLRST